MAQTKRPTGDREKTTEGPEEDQAAEQPQDKARRLRWSVPRVDVSTNQWLDLQNDPSQSLQLLIRESILRDGYVDVVNKPIEQLPRRGRPPGPANVETRGDEDELQDEAPQLTEPEKPEVAEDAHEEPESVEPAQVEGARQGTPPDPVPTPPAPAGLDAFLTR